MFADISLLIWILLWKTLTLRIKSDSLKSVWACIHVYIIGFNISNSTKLKGTRAVQGRGLVSDILLSGQEEEVCVDYEDM